MDSNCLDRLKVHSTSYGEVAYHRQGEIIRDLAKPHEPVLPDANSIAEAVYKKLHSSGIR